MTLPFANIPAGLTNPDQLRRIAAVAEKYGGSLKITGGTIERTGWDAFLAAAIPAAYRQKK